jgi:tetrahydrodipicolinate N-succinyltransferase
MRKFYLLCIVILFSSCKCRTEEQKVIYTVVYDTVQIDKGFEQKYDSLLLLFQKLPKENDSIKAVNKHFANELLHKKLIIENAKYYLEICNKNPSQDKFLKGWMNRALYQ